MPQSNDRVTDLTVTILREIRDETRQTNTRLDSLQQGMHESIGQTNARLDGLQHEMGQANARLDQTNSRLDSLQLEMRKGFEHVGQRIDNLLLGPHREDHEQIHKRLDRIEQHLNLTGT